MFDHPHNLLTEPDGMLSYQEMFGNYIPAEQRYLEREIKVIPQQTPKAAELADSSVCTPAPSTCLLDHCCSLMFVFIGSLLW